MVDKKLVGDLVSQNSLVQALGLPTAETISLSLLVKLFRVSRDLEYKDIAENFAITRHLLSDIENGHIPSRRKIDELSKIFGEGFERIVKVRNYFGTK